MGEQKVWTESDVKRNMSPGQLSILPTDPFARGAKWKKV